MENNQDRMPASLDADKSTELRTESGVVNHMNGSTSEDDWNERCDEVKAANGGDYPKYWFNKVIMSGLASRVASKW